jgi:hypothetical protein
MTVTLLNMKRIEVRCGLGPVGREGSAFEVVYVISEPNCLLWSFADPDIIFSNYSILLYALLLPNRSIETGVSTQRRVRYGGEPLTA